MELSTLKTAPRPTLPKFTLQTDKRVQYILNELEKIRNTKKRKQLKKCEHLVYYIIQTLRKGKEDHLLHTTAIWVLIVLFRLFPIEIKAVMLQSGIPGILHDILQLGSLSGSSRQYASELVFFLSTNYEYEPNESTKGGGPMTRFPEIQAFNRYQPDLDDISIMSDMSSVDNAEKPSRKPFIPYRIDEANMMKMDSLFEKGYEAQLAASLPNVGLMSKYGFSFDQENIPDEDDVKYARLEGEGPGFLGRLRDDEEEEDDDDDDEDAVSDSSSEGGEHHSPYNFDMKNGNGFGNDQFSDDMSSGNRSLNNNLMQKDVFITQNRKQSNLALAAKKRKTEVYRKNSFLMHQFNSENNSLSSGSTQRKMTAEQLYKNTELIDRPKTSVVLRQQHPISKEEDYLQKPVSSPFRLGKILENQKSKNKHHHHHPHYSELDFSGSEENSLAYSAGGGSISGGSSHRSVFSTQSLDRFPAVVSAPHRVVQQLRTNNNNNHNNNFGGDSRRSSFTSAPAGMMIGMGQRPNTTSATMRFPNTQQGKRGRSALQDDSEENSSAQGFRSFFGPPARSTPQTPIDIYSRKKLSASILSASQLYNSVVSSSVDQLMSEIDPFALPATMTSSIATDAPNKINSEKKFSNRFKVNIQVPDNSRRDVDMTSDIDEEETKKKRKKRRGGKDGKEETAAATSEEEEPNVGEEKFENEDYWDSSDEEMNDYYQKLVETEIEEETKNPFIKIKRLRIRAEKLIDHKFIHALFVKKMTVQDTQDLIRRMEDIIFLLDPQETGYITFEQFTKIISAVAPKHLLKQNIHQFFEYQTDSMANLIDYQEFLISGKVLVLTKLQQQQYEASKQKMKTLLTATPEERQAMQEKNEIFAYRNENHTYTKAWLNRQKQYIGDSSTYTWKNHLKWYQTRKSQVLIWLIRRARRALEYEIHLLKAFESLKKLRFKAFAQTDLMALGKDALLAQQQREESKKRLNKRVYHARNYMRKVRDAYEYLKYVGIGAIKDMEYYHRTYGGGGTVAADSSQPGGLGNTQQDRMLAAQQKTMRDVLAAIQKQKLQSIVQKKVNYGNLYKVSELQKLAARSLRQFAQKALKHCQIQDLAYQQLIDSSRNILLQQFKKEKIRRELVMIAERALAFNLQKDQIQLGLLRIGEKMRRWISNQIDALNWLLEKGKHTKAFLEKQYSKGYDLIIKSRKLLNFMNQREFSFEYLSKRCQKSLSFINKKKEAIEYLKRKPYKLWDVFDHQNEVQKKLAEYGARAKKHLKKKAKAVAYLQYLASKAASQHRKSQITYQELCQIGMKARYEVFKQSLLKKENKRLFSIYLKEKELIIKNDLKIMQNYQTFYEKKMLSKGILVKSPSRSRLTILPLSPSPPPAAARRAAALANAAAESAAANNNSMMNSSRLQLSSNQLEESTPSEEDPEKDYSAKVMSIKALSAKLNGIQEAPTKRPAGSKSPSRKLLSSKSSSFRSPERQFILPTEVEEENKPVIAVSPSSDQLLLPAIPEDNSIVTTESAPPPKVNNEEKIDEKEDEKVDEKADEPEESRTFELTAVSQSDNNDPPAEEESRMSRSRPQSAALSSPHLISNNNSNDNSQANLMNQNSTVSFSGMKGNNRLNSSLPRVSYTASMSRPVSSSSTSRLRTPLLDNTLSRPSTSGRSISNDNQHPFTILIENIVKLELIESFQLISSIYTPAFILAKNKLEKLQLILPAIPQLEGATNPSSPAAGGNKPGMKPVSAGKKPTATITTATSTTASNNEEDPDAAEKSSINNNNAQYDLIGRYGFIKLLNHGKYLQLSEIAVQEIFRNLDTNTSCYVSISNVYYFLWKELQKKHKLVKYLMTNNPPLPAGGGTTGSGMSQIMSMNATNDSRPGTAPTVMLLATASGNRTGNTNSNSMTMSRSGLIRNANNTSMTPVAVDVKKLIPPNRIVMNDILSTDERAIMLLYKRMLRDDSFYQSLLETEQSKKLSAFEEYRLRMQKLADEKAALAALEEEEYDDYNYGDEEEDEDLLFSDLERLKKMDVGRLMKYLTKKREAKKEEEALTEEQKQKQQQQSPPEKLRDNSPSATSTKQISPPKTPQENDLLKEKVVTPEKK